MSLWFCHLNHTGWVINHDGSRGTRIHQSNILLCSKWDVFLTQYTSTSSSSLKKSLHTFWTFSQELTTTVNLNATAEPFCYSLYRIKKGGSTTKIFAQDYNPHDSSLIRNATENFNNTRLNLQFQYAAPGIDLSIRAVCLLTSAE